MSSITFDTLAYSDSLQKAGISRAHAEAMAKAQAAALDKMLEASQFATKHDLRELELRLKLEIQRSQNTMRNWFIGTALAIIAALAAVASLVISRLPGQ